jgi:hypothetical protein
MIGIAILINQRIEKTETENKSNKNNRSHRINKPSDRKIPTCKLGSGPEPILLST